MQKNSNLTPKEIEFCIEFINTKGQSGWQKIIANNMKISISTVNMHKSNAFEILLVNNTTELMHKLLTTNEWRIRK